MRRMNLQISTSEFRESIEIIPDYQFQKVFYVSLCNNFFTVFLWRPLSCGGPWATAQFAPFP